MLLNRKKNIYKPGFFSRKWILGMMILAVWLFMNCRKAYTPRVITANNRFLTINGVINMATQGITTIQLSRTLNLVDTVTSNPEAHASVLIEGENGFRLALTETADGTYSSQPLTLDNSTRYRLDISTSDGSNYQSDYVQCKITPPIDSITWRQDSGVTISVNTHDPSNNSRYYRWDFVETWVYHPQLHTIWGSANGIVILLDETNQTDSCWHELPSTDIMLGTSSALSRDVIFQLPVYHIPNNDGKLDFRYSVMFRQYALTEQAYHYWQIIQRNSQQLGSLFDPQPSQVNGNIHSLTDPEEPVIGFVSASSVQERRIFITNQQLNNWKSIPSGFACNSYNTGLHYRVYNVTDTSLGPYYYASGELVVASKACMDCRYLGGTNQVPSFW